MPLSVKLLGYAPFALSMQRASRLFGREATKNLRKAAVIVTGEAQKQFRGSRTRARFTVSGGKRVRRRPPLPVSSPPDRLGVFEGKYRQSISFDFIGRHAVEVGPAGVPYARSHEFGLGSMPVRQVLTPAIDNTEEKVYALLGRTFRVVG